MGLRTAVFTVAAALAAAVTCVGQEAAPEPEIVQLSGVFRRPVKWSPQLEIWPANVVKQIDLQGKLVESNEARADLKDGQPIKVWGVVRTRLHRGGPDTPFPSQWIVELEVTRLEKLDDARDVLR